MDYTIDEAGQLQDTSGNSTGDFQKISQIAERHLADQRDLIEQLEAEFRHYRAENPPQVEDAERSRSVVVGFDIGKGKISTNLFAISTPLGNGRRWCPKANLRARSRKRPGPSRALRWRSTSDRQGS